MKKLTKALIGLLASALIAGAIPISATEASGEAKDLTPSSFGSALHDLSASTYESLTEFTITANENVSSLYIVFRKTPLGFTVTCGEESVYFEGKFLQYYADLSDKFSGETKELTVTLDDGVSISEIYAFGEGELPEFVHKWDSPHEKADLLLMSTHADDEHLFFAGILPYYAGELGYRVQVAYFTDHKNEPGRRHELLNGLWEVGIRNYPVISEYNDVHSTTKEDALANVEKEGFTEDHIIAYQTMLLRRFKPLVVVGHDINGEYGHGQHMLNTDTLIKAITAAADENAYPDTAAGLGIWDTPKLYIHLYEENQITLNWDTPLEKFDGKTAFQISQKGFDWHESQHNTWFKTWLNGKSGANTAAANINQHSPCLFGLYRTTVGEDVSKNDFFENVTIYAEQERIAAEEEAKRQEEESKRLEEESRKAAEEESKKLEAETTAPETTEAPKPPRRLHPDLIFAAIVVAGIAIASVLTVAFMKKHAKPKKK